MSVQKTKNTLNEPLKTLLDEYHDKVGKINNSSELFDIYSPWNNFNIEKMIESFNKALQSNSNNFSWLDIEEDLPKSTDVDIKYGLPNHIKGNIDEATLFLCLVNPNIDEVKTEKKDVGIHTYYKKAREMESGDDSLNILNDKGKLRIDPKVYIKEHILDVRETSSILYNELQIVKQTRSYKDTYYLGHYLPHFIKEFLNKKGSFKNVIHNLTDEWDELEKMSKKIANLEAFPFRSQNPN
ncbi:TPA: hypothetical protein VQK26_001835, partial [Streptococcus pneumoniae]|nr:hypothetical protein [Streptococcus pneumoniae]